MHKAHQPDLPKRLTSSDAVHDTETNADNELQSRLQSGKCIFLLSLLGARCEFQDASILGQVLIAVSVDHQSDGTWTAKADLAPASTQSC